MLGKLGKTAVSKTMIKNAGKAAAGGAVASAIFHTTLSKVDFFSKGSDSKIILAKKVGLAAGVALLGGAFAKKQKMDQVASGMAGALGALVMPLILTEFGVTIPGVSVGPVSGYGCGGSMAGYGYSYPALAGATVHEEDILGLRVGEEEPEFAGLFAGAMAY